MGFVKTPAELAAYYGVPARKFPGARMLGTVFQTRPEIIARLLPAPLEPTDVSNGLVFIAEYPETNLGPGYRESALFLNCQYKGEAGTYCLAMPIDSEEVRCTNGRDIFGFPKKLASIHLEREGATVRGWVERHGIRFFEMKVDLMSEMPSLPPTGPNFLFKASPRIDLQPGFDGPVFLCKQKTEVQMRSLEVGMSELTFKDSPRDPWSEIEVTDVIMGFYMVSDNTMRPGEIVAQVDGDAFLPYYFKMTDFAVGT
ncbi:MAG: acetoacetate decarboxylase family protein [Deltaproteobacteria bacterium]